jgi:hypothetical protein
LTVARSTDMKHSDFGFRVGYTGVKRFSQRDKVIKGLKVIRLAMSQSGNNFS